MNLTLSKNAAVLISLITGVVEAVVGLLVAFNVDVTEPQRTAILTLVGAVGAATAVIGPIIRQFVWSEASHIKEVNAAAANAARAATAQAVAQQQVQAAPVSAVTPATPPVPVTTDVATP
jgi:hypothetical protein